MAAIAGRLAAELFTMQIIAPDIHTLKNNYTRFLVLKREENIQKIDAANKASVSFRTDHSRGSLAKVLSKIAEAGINLSKLQIFLSRIQTGNTVFMRIWNLKISASSKK